VVTHSPARRGGVAAPVIKRREATEAAQTGWSVRHNPCSRLRMSLRKASLFNTRSKKGNRRNLRRHSTAAEAVLWTYLQGRKLLGKKFRRQSSVGPYIVDFYCMECRLIVELAGAPHFAANADGMKNFERNTCKKLV